MAYPPPAAGAPSRPRYVLLDLLRICAALWVVVFHWTPGTHAIASAPTWFAGMTLAGYLGVGVFFKLSGAVIVHTALGRTRGEFGAERFLRLAPAFFGVTVLTIAALAVNGTPSAAALSWLNLTGLHFFFNERSLVSVAWTLLDELQFYILAACLVYAKLIERTGDMGLDDAGTIAWSLGTLLVIGGIILLSALRPIDLRPPWMRSAISTFALMTYPLSLLHLELGKGLLNRLWRAGVTIPLAVAIAAATMFLLSGHSSGTTNPGCVGGFARSWDGTQR